jgi:cytidyltransferase-like protein
VTPGITFGSFDLSHLGHPRMLQRAANLGDRLVVALSTDRLDYDKKRRRPAFRRAGLVENVAALPRVDALFLGESLQLERQYVLAAAV